MSETDDETESSGPATIQERGTNPRILVLRRFRVTSVEGDQSGKTWESAGERTSIGSHPSNDVVIQDPLVSRFHCEILVDGRGARIRDTNSTNGTTVDGVGLIEGFLESGSVIRLGKTALSFASAEASPMVHVPLATRSQFGSLVGSSTPMRAVFARLERAAASDATILLDGETGTGKGEAAAAVHKASVRRGKPFVTIDCGSIPENLVESGFGHEKGAFTGADTRRLGAFEQADGGTIFLDEVGELPLDIQPKLLRALENREVRRLGGPSIKIDVRVIAATNRDLRVEVNQGRFRSDLYFRLAVVGISMPALRQRPEDIPALVHTVLDRLNAPPPMRALLLAPGTLARLSRAAWRGNVRELRNYVERCIVYDQALPVSMAELEPAPDWESGTATGDIMPFSEARQRAIAEFERDYLDRLMAKSSGTMVEAAAKAGIGRTYLYKLMVKHGIK